MLFLLLAAVAAAHLQAADAVFDAKGFNPNREFASELPFEHVDPMTGNLLLTFTDLVLPGNAGFDLRIQRTYNSKVYENLNSLGGYTLSTEDSWAGLGWTLHFGRVWNPSSSQPGPLIEMPDGSRHATFHHKDGDSNHFMTRDYWTYDRNAASPVLRLPNGVRYTFGRSVVFGPQNVLFVTRIEDAFGNNVTIDYYEGAGVPPDAVRTIQQRLSSTEVRTVSFTYDPTLLRPDGQPTATGSLRSMTFLGRQWNYQQTTMPYFGYTLLAGVQPPVGPGWGFEYYDMSGATPWLMKRITMPGGGRVDYAFTPQAFNVGSGVIYTPSLLSRSTSGPDVVPGTWQYAYNSTSWQQPVVSTVDSVTCGIRTRYTFQAIGPSGDEKPWAIGAMVEKATGDLANHYPEVESLTWSASVPISNDPESGNSFVTHVPLLASRSVAREGHTYTTTHAYNLAVYSSGRASNFNDFGRPIHVHVLLPKPDAGPELPGLHRRQGLG
jgi:hypothetical protein